MAKPQDRRSLLAYYVKQYKAVYGTAPVVNNYKSQWIFDAILTTIDADEVKALIDFYLSTVSSNAHDLDWFGYNYDKVIKTMAEYKEDEANRKRLREQTRLKVEEWRNRGVNRTKGSELSTTE